MAFVSQFSRGVAVKKSAPKVTTSRPKTAPQNVKPLGPIIPSAMPAPVIPPPGSAAPAPLPPDASYEAQAGALKVQHSTTLAGLEQQRGQGLLQYGYTQDASGGLAFDPNNPFSQAALLKRNYDQARQGNTTSYAAQGQLYSGALANAQNETNFSEQQGSDALQKQLLAFLANNLQGKNQAGADYGTGMANALSGRLDRAPQNPAYSPVTSAPAPPPSQAAKAALGDPVVKEIAHTDSTGRKGVIKVHKSGRRVFVPRG